jgi:DNA-directed RNA polymerase II subunit RPB2
MLAKIDNEVIPPNVFDEYTWKVIDSYFSPNKGYQLVKHQIESFNDFVLRKIVQIIDGFNPIDVNFQYLTDFEKFKYSISIEVKNPQLMKPIIYEKDGSTKNMTPNDAKLRNFTYSSAITVDILITAKTLNDDGSFSIDTKQITGVSLGKVPIMVKSNYCILKNTSIDDSECKYDYGGYFIINGNEKAVISQDRISENKTFVFTNNKVSTYSHIAEIRSVQENRLGVPKITTIKLSSKPNQFGRYIRVNIHHIKHDIPLFILFRAMGLTHDKEIIEYIVYNLNDNTSRLICSQLMGCVEEANQVMCERDAIEYLARYLNITGYPREYMSNKINRINLVRSVLEKEVLPHVGKDLKKKALYVGYMVNKLIQCFMGLKEFDDRDSYINKRVDTPGVLLAAIFRQYYGKMIKDMKNMVQKEINVGGWKVTNKLVNVINKVNIYKIIKSTIIDSGLRYALATGNWGIKSNKNKQGVAQVLNRMSYNASLSHLRRVNTPIEKSGKLIQPRKLHATQWGVICPAETPEGQSVGLVKNMAMMANITICSNSTNIRELLENELGVVVFGEQNNYDISMFSQNTKIMINGDILGVHTEPQVLYTKLKTLKQKGCINVYTSIVWNFRNNEISISTEGGRCVRPLFIVDNKNGFAKCRLTKSVAKKLDEGKITWRELVTGSGDMDANDSVIEYMDVEETNAAMIAMTYGDVIQKSLGVEKVGSITPNVFTNMEIHPSVIMGVLASCIPFSDHNQAPRVCYQSSMGKQAIGIYTSNFRQRYDTMGHVLNYGQRPLVKTNMSSILNNDDLPCGINAIVAIATYTGFNQEDSVILNKSAIERGLFTSTYYKTYKELNNKNHSNGEEEFFTKPDTSIVKNVKPYNYDKLENNGFVPENTFVKSGDVIIGKVMPTKIESCIQYKDNSATMKANEQGFIDRNGANDKYFTNTNGDGYSFAKVRIRSDRTPTVGDKFSCYTPDHEVLTTRGWISIDKVSKQDKIACLVNDQLVYDYPLEVQSYEFEGELYKVESNQVKLLVTDNHRMYVKTRSGPFRMELASEVEKRRRLYKKNVDSVSLNLDNAPKELVIKEDTITKFKIENEHGIFECDINDWIVFFGIWVAEGSTSKSTNCVSIAAYKDRVKIALEKCSKNMGIEFKKCKDKSHHTELHHWYFSSKCINDYLRQCGTLSINKTLPHWVWFLSQVQCRDLIAAMCLGDGHTMINGTRRYDTSSTVLADDFQRLCLHAGWSANKLLKYKAGHTTTKCSGEIITSRYDAYRLTINTKQNLPLVNKNMIKGREEETSVDGREYYKGKVYCCTVPQGDGVIYVRRHGYPVWCGNSRHGHTAIVRESKVPC